MRYGPSGARRVGAAICLCVIAGSAVVGCRGNGAAPSATPAPTHYAKSQILATSLSSIGQLSGPLKGTLKIGSDAFPLSGTVSLNGKNSQIDMDEEGSAQLTVHEILVDGRRYSSPDGTIWIDRGPKPKGASLAEVLAAADTTLDLGTSTVNGVSAHKIPTGADVVDMAPALGIDTSTFDRESTTLRIWADASGKVLGFGASMSWLVTLGGVQESVSADLDVMFTYSSPVEIAAPDKPWQWIEDKPVGIAFAIPPGWTKDPTSNKTSTYYSLRSEREIMGYSQMDVGPLSLDQFTGAAASAVQFGVGDSHATSLAFEPAERASASDAKTGLYAVMVTSIHETLGYFIMVGGPRTVTQAVDNLTDQILTTVEYTR